MGTEQKRKSSRFSRWRERLRAKALRASEIERRAKDVRSGRGHHDNRGGGDSGSMGGGGAGI